MNNKDSFKINIRISITVNAQPQQAATAAPHAIVRIPVDSRSLASVGYRASDGTLEIEFKNGGLYSYHSVPSRYYRELMAAESKGTYFTRSIRNAFMFDVLAKPPSKGFGR